MIKLLTPYFSLQMILEYTHELWGPSIFIASDVDKTRSATIVVNDNRFLFLNHEEGTDLMSSTVSEYIVYGDLASNGSRSMALPHSINESAPSA